MFSIILDQSVKTKDNVPVVIDTIVYYKITDRSKFFELSNNPQNIIDNLAIKALHAIIKIYQIDLKRVSFENEDEKERKNK